jgi:Transposase IS200 like
MVVMAMRKRIGNLDFDTASHCVYHLTIPVVFSAAKVLDKFGEVYYGRHARTFWSSGFFLCSVGGATLEILKTYIENQGEPVISVHKFSLVTKDTTFECLNQIPDAPAQTIERPSDNPCELPRSETRHVPLQGIMTEVIRLHFLPRV